MITVKVNGLPELLAKLKEFKNEQIKDKIKRYVRKP